MVKDDAYVERLNKAAMEYLRRNAVNHPTKFKIPDEERRLCCFGIREPSGKFPFSELAHARTLIHIANVFDVEVADLKKFSAVIKKLG